MHLLFIILLNWFLLGAIGCGIGILLDTFYIHKHTPEIGRSFPTILVIISIIIGPFSFYFAYVTFKFCIISLVLGRSKKKKRRNF